MKGLTMASLKKNPALIPLFSCIGFGGLIATLYTLRLAFRNPDVSWFPTKNPEPWQEYATKEYKFYQPTKTDVKSPAPKY